MIKALRQIRSANDEMMRIQDATRDWAEQFKNFPIISGVLLEDLTITTGQANLIDHKLGKEPFGFIVVRNSANAVIWQNSIDARNIDVRSSANAVVSLWVF